MTPDDSERGKRASVASNGEVQGSGSGAGGNGNPREDYDSHAYQGGGGRKQMGGPKPIDEAEERPHAEEGPDQ